MLARDDVGVRRLAVRTRGPRDPAARLAAARLVSGLAPPRLPPSSILIVKALRALAPADQRGQARWAKDMRDGLEAIAARAARPGRGPVPPDAPAVLFLDLAELWACLAADLLAGVDRWYWAALFRRMPDWSRWVEEAEAHPEVLIEGFALLGKRHLDVEVVSSLAPRLRRRLLEVAAEIAKVLAGLPAAEVFQRAPQGKLTSPMFAFPAAAPIFEQLLIGGPRASPKGLHPEARALLAITGALATPSAAQHRQQLLRWLEAVGPQPPTLDATRLSMTSPAPEVATTAASRAMTETRPRGADPTRAPSTHHGEARPQGPAAAPTPATGSPWAPAPTRIAAELADASWTAPSRTPSGVDPAPARALARVEVELTSRSGAAPMADGTTTRVPHDTPCAPYTTMCDVPPSMIQDERAVSSEPDPEAGTVTSFAGIFHLVHVLAELRPQPILDVVDGWTVLEALGRAFVGPEAPPDPIWALLARLAERDPARPLAESLAETPAFVPPERWRRLEVGPTAPDVAAASAAISGWLRSATPWIEARIGDSAAGLTARGVIVRPGHVYVTRTHVDVVQSIDAADLNLRRAGLDRDPGWCPWLRRVVQFFFV